MIDPVLLAAFLLASVALYLTPGADMMFVSASGAQGGRRVGIAAGLGVSLGSLSHTVLAVIGVAALIRTHALAYDLLRWAGAGYLLFLAITTWRSSHSAAEQGASRVWQAFRRGALTNLLNPKVSIFVLAFLPQFTDPARGPVWMQIAVLGTIFTLASIPFNCSYGALAGAFSGWLGARMRTMNRITSIIFGGLAARLVID